MTFRELTSPNSCPGTYTLDCYCDHENDQHSFREFPHQYQGQTEGECKREARQDGWRFHHGGTATCPKCMKRKKTEKPAGSFRLDEENP
jgi:hypothetical protein